MASKNVRTGSELRRRAAAVHASKVKKYVCPKTGKSVKRVSHCIWESSGGYRYAGGAYALSTPTGEVFSRMIKEYKAKKKEAPKKK